MNIDSPTSANQTPGPDGTFDLESGETTPVQRRSRGRPKRMLSDDSDGDNNSLAANRSRRLRARGEVKSVPKSERISASVVPADAIMEPHQIVDDETVLAHLDQEGERKVDENGSLFGDREYRVRTFTVKGRGNRLYMLSTEPARCQGYRDSYLFFIRHKTLHKIVLEENEKQDLVDRDLVPAGYKTRHIAVCTARSVFREFGARIIIGGRRIIDDYWVKEYQNLGYTEGTLADPEDRLPPPGIEYNRNQYVAWHGASSVYHREPPIERRSTRRAPAMDDPNWIYAHAQATSQYNTELGDLRRRMRAGVYEPHMSTRFLPAATQPVHYTWEIDDHDHQEQDSHDPGVVVRVLMRPRVEKPFALNALDESVLAVVPSDIKASILSQENIPIALAG